MSRFCRTMLCSFCTVDAFIASALMLRSTAVWNPRRCQPVPDDGKLSRVLGVLELSVRNVFAFESGDQHRLREQCGIAKAWSVKNDAIRVIPPHGIDQTPAALPIRRIAGGRRHALRQVSLRQVFDRVTLLGYSTREPAQTQEQ